MTDKTQPEAMDLADWLEAVGGGPSAKRCAALLREQHTRIAELESELEAVGAGGVQALSAAPEAIAKLRHLYQNMVNGAVRDTASAKRIAEGLLAPAIEALERGTPPAVAGEPECTCSAKDAPFGTCCKVRSAFERWYDEQNYGRLQPFDVFKGGWIERHRLSSTPQPTKAQAGAVPLTDAQLAEMMRDTWGCASIAPRHALEFARAVERAHGITQKGGSNAE